MKYQKLNHSSNLHFYTMNHVDSPKKKKKAMNHVIGRYSFFFLNNLNPKVIILDFGLLQLDTMQGNNDLKRSKELQ